MERVSARLNPSQMTERLPPWTVTGRWFRTLSLVLVTAGLASCSVGDDSSPLIATDEISMPPGQTFDPSGASVAPGTTVSFVNDSSEAHTVTAYENDIPPGADYFASGGPNSESEARDDLTSGLIAEGETFEATFTEPGTYLYFCIPHEGAGMKGTIVVEE